MKESYEQKLIKDMGPLPQEIGGHATPRHDEMPVPQALALSI
jgi:hypothetical protein